MKNTDILSGVRFKHFLPSSRVGSITLSDDVPFDTQEQCPGCLTQLTTFCRLTSNKGKGRTMRVGVCSKCGYFGFQDRPTKEWITNYYRKDWDKEFSRTVEDIRARTELPTGPKGGRRTAFLLHEELPVNKERAFLDIGSGYGEVLKNMRDAGFSQVVGIENSQMRADRVHEALDLNIVVGAFGDEDSTRTLKEHAPFGLIFSHHVLEHVYHPREAIDAISKLQEEGDSLILALPNSKGEHIMYQALFLPHLHGFTKESLEIMLNAYGYEIRVDKSPDDTNIIIGAVKTQNPKAMFTLQNDYLKQATDRLVYSLGMNTVPEGKTYELFWEQGVVEHGRAEQKVVTIPTPLHAMFWAIRSFKAFIFSRFLKRFVPGYTMLFEMRNPSATLPMTISFDGPIQLMIK